MDNSLKRTLKLKMWECLSINFLVFSLQYCCFVGFLRRPLQSQVDYQPQISEVLFLYFISCVFQHCFVHPGRVAGPVLWGLLEPSKLRVSASAPRLPSPPLPRLGPGAPCPQPAGPLPPKTAVWAWSWWYEGRTREGHQSRQGLL